MARMAVAAVLPIPRMLHISPLSKREWEDILSPAAVELVATLARVFEPRRRELLAERRRRQARIDNGAMPDFLPHTETVRKTFWSAAPAPADLVDRRVELVGPVERRALIEGLNSNANVYVADFEDATAASWACVLDGQVNLRDAVRNDLAYIGPEGMPCELSDRAATLMVRPRGWHRTEVHMLVDGEPVSAAIFDFGLFFFHNARALLRKRSAPYFSLAKLEGYEEASLWNDMFVFAEEALRIARGTIRAAVAIETVAAAFEMDEILYELRDRSAGLTFGHRNYVCSYMRTFGSGSSFSPPDRAAMGCDRHFLRSLAELLVHTCHRRGVHAVGAVSNDAPVRGYSELTAQAVERVRRDKLRDVAAGFDGSAVAHPAMVPAARETFDVYMGGANQIHRLAHDVRVSADDLLRPPCGPRTEAGLRCDIETSIRCLDAHLREQGSLSIYNLVEDTATFELCRTRIWHWVRHGVRLDDGRTVTAELVKELVASQLKRIRLATGVERFHMGWYRRAAAILQDLVTRSELPEFCEQRRIESH
jgi:malate synthase